jgi:hypothetical protein
MIIAALVLAGILQICAAGAADESDTELAKKTQNPVADRISVPFQNNFNLDQPAAFLPQLLFICRLEAELAEVGVGARAAREHAGDFPQGSQGEQGAADRRWTREAVQAVTADHYVQIAGLSPSRFRTELCRDMQAAFAPYGPSPQDFPAAAVHYALALILSRLHVEEGAEIDTIAARIRKRLDRV